MIALLLLIGVLLLALNAFFVLAEYAIIRLRPSRVEELTDQGNSTAKLIQDIQAHLDEYLSVTQVGITFCSVGLGFVGEPSIAHLIAPLLTSLGASATVIHTVAVTIAYVLVSFLHIVIGEQVPKLMAVRVSDKAALLTARPLRVFRRVFVVPLFVLKHSVRAILRLIGMPENPPEERHSEEELRIILEQSQTGGLMSFRRLLLLENVFDFGELKVRDVMRSRGSVKVLRVAAPWEVNYRVIKESRLSRFPLLEEGNERPVGVVHVKDILYSDLERVQQIDLRKIARPIVTATEGAPLESLLADLQRRRGHLAIVLDKAGKWTGLVSFEDIVEEVVGTVEDEFETEPQIFLADALTAGRVVLGVEAPTLEDALRRGLAQIDPSELPRPREAIARLVLDRTRLVGTYLGRGLAIPHARAEGLERAVLIFVRSDQGIPVEGRDEKSFLHFILISPSNQPRVHVRLLARIAGIFESEYVEERLREATTPQEVLEAIRAGEAAALG